MTAQAAPDSAPVKETTYEHIRMMRRINDFANTASGRRLIGAATIVVVLVLWQVLSITGVLPAQAFPSAFGMLSALGELLARGIFWPSLWSTISVVLLSLTINVVIATPLAMLLGQVRAAEESTWFVLEFLKPIPPVALIPLGLLLWGPVPEMKLCLIVFGSVWPLLTQLIYGIQEVDSTSADLSRSYRLGGWLTFSRIIVPSMLPFALTGLRISAAIALIVSVVTEMVGGAEGIGQSIVVAQSAGAVDHMYALIVTTGLLGLAINAGLVAIERPVLFWHPSAAGRTS